MKIDYESYTTKMAMELDNALKHAMTPSAYSYDGTIERLEAKIEKLLELVVRLVEVVVNEDARFDTNIDGQLNTSQIVEHILGYGYKVTK